MLISAFSDPGASGHENEDWVSAKPGLIVVLDGATARTDTGCTHGISWYSANLGAAISAFAADGGTALVDVLRLAIERVADQHRECDLSQPGTPSAAVAILRTNSAGMRAAGEVDVPGGLNNLHNEELEYLTLGDVTVVLDCGADLQVITDARVDATASTERAEADRQPIGSPEKQAALLRMKYAELAARNKPDGYWIAAADPGVVTEALAGRVPLSTVRRAAVLSDGGARIVRLFKLLDWPALLDLLDKYGPADAVRQVRALEAADPYGHRWPRNKRSDDATIAYARFD